MGMWLTFRCNTYDCPNKANYRTVEPKRVEEFNNLENALTYGDGRKCERCGRLVTGGVLLSDEDLARLPR